MSHWESGGEREAELDRAGKARVRQEREEEGIGSRSLLLRRVGGRWLDFCARLQLWCGFCWISIVLIFKRSSGETGSGVEGMTAVIPIGTTIAL